uniref:Keratin, type II cytoskeletal 8-like n=1 Tax=Cynoglossus semilaevis TaxID=244447 RepID=A0A3P8X6I2_CYNSE
KIFTKKNYGPGDTGCRSEPGRRLSFRSTHGSRDMSLRITRYTGAQSCHPVPKVRAAVSERGAAITAVTFNSSLLTPINVSVDPTIQVVRTQEKEQIKGLNNRFASFIDKVRYLEQQNKMLETKWSVLKEQTDAASNIEPMLKSYILGLEQQLDFHNQEKQRLDMENSVMHKNVDDYKNRYEKEIHMRTDAENEFVMLKKDVDSGYMSRVELDDRVSGLAEELDFLKTLYDTELRELQESLKDTSVVVEMDNSRALDMDQIVAEVKAQYEDVATRSREEVERWYKDKFNQMSAQAELNSDEMRNTKAEMAELKRMISRLQNEIQALKNQVVSLEGQITEAERRGEDAVKEARFRILELEQALQKTKQDMTLQLKQYQELMNVKLSLDIEISTYMKLLEGEEQSHHSVWMSFLLSLSFLRRCHLAAVFARHLFGQGYEAGAGHLTVHLTDALPQTVLLWSKVGRVRGLHPGLSL